MRKLFKAKSNAQSTLEFLTNYVWALIIIIIVIAILAYFGLLDYKKYLSDRCIINSEISCKEFAIYQTDAGTGILKLKLKNGLSESIILSLGDTFSDSSIPFKCNIMPPPSLIPSGSAQDFQYADCNNNESGLVIGKKSKINFKVSYYSTQSGQNYNNEAEGEVIATVISAQGITNLAQCSDGIDNDGNGCIDYAGGDTGCISPNDDNESGGFCANGGGANNPLFCFVADNCPNTIIFKISSLSDAHAEIPSMANYGYKVCCRSDTDILSNSCISPQAIPLHLSGNTDAHVEKNTQSSYNVNVCLSASIKAVQCRYSNLNCDSSETCLATISGDTDAHVGDCITQPFGNKICCKLT